MDNFSDNLFDCTSLLSLSSSDAANRQTVLALGNPAILSERKLALFCSRQCPGNVILRVYDLARHLRDKEQTVISGFHSPIEQEILSILLRSKQPIIICPARSLEGMRLSSAWRSAIDEGRLLLLSPFTENITRTSARNAIRRNEFVANIADEILIIHTAPKSETEKLTETIKTKGKIVRYFEKDFEL
jgi:predicted Rossmann fold nucleotide-binding protein DprA/Smf involved in DNA uptake